LLGFLEREKIWGNMGVEEHMKKAKEMVGLV